MDFKEKRVIITGASSGIGLALAREFARRGARVVMGARSGEKLETLAREIDPDCFMIVSRVTEVWGRGFSRGKHYGEESQSPAK